MKQQLNAIIIIAVLLMEEMKNAHKFQVENLKKREYMGDQDVDGRTLLNKYGVRTWTRLVWLRTEIIYWL
jgi:hypothetical protein